MMTTLADLIVRAHLHRASFPKGAFHSMRKAVLRVAEAAGTLPQDHDAADVLAEHAALVDKEQIRRDQHREEQANLTEMLALPALPEDLSRRIYAGRATIEDALTVVGLQHDPTKWEQVAMALRSFAGNLPEGVETVVGGRRLEALLDRHSHLDVGLQRSTWQVRKSLIRRGVRLVDMETKQSLKTTMLSGAWRDRIEAVNPGRGQKGTRTSRQGLGHHVAKVWPLVVFCWREGIGPHDVNDCVVQRFLVDLEAQKGKRAFDKAQAAIYAWEWLQAASASWPQQKLSRLYRSRATSSPHQLQFEDLPAELQASWLAYVDRTFENDEVSAPLADLVPEPEADSDDGEEEEVFKVVGDDNAAEVTGVPTIFRNRRTLPDFKCVFLYAANVAINRLGMTPKTVAELLTPDVLVKVLNTRYDRQKRRARDRGEDLVPQRKNLTLKHTVGVFKGMASDLGVDERLIAGIDSIYDQVHPHIIGRDRNTGDRIFTSNKMGPRHQEMLRQFGRKGGQEKLMAWFQLPEKLFNKVHKKYERVGAKGLSDKEIADLITAVVGGIIRSCPLRRANLGQLRIGVDREKNLGPNLYLPDRSQQVGRIYLLATEIKKGRDDFGVWLTLPATRYLKFYVEKVRREVMRRRGSNSDNPYLFPSYGARHRPLELITKHWVKRCKEAGFELDLHANRHLTATVILQRDVNAMPMVQKILGHKNLRTTEDYYAEVKDYLVQTEFQTHLEEAEHALSLDLLVALKGVKK